EINKLEVSRRRIVNVQGFKGPSPLINLKLFPLIDGITLDYMHVVAIGIVKQFLVLWRTAGMPYSLSRTDVSFHLLSLNSRKFSFFHGLVYLLCCFRSLRLVLCLEALNLLQRQTYRLQSMTEVSRLRTFEISCCFTDLLHFMAYCKDLFMSIS